MAIGDNASTNPRADKQADSVLYSACCAVYPFPVSSRANIVHNHSRQACRILQLRPERDILPLQVRPVANGPCRMVDLSRDTNSQARGAGRLVGEALAYPFSDVARDTGGDRR